MASPTGNTTTILDGVNNSTNITGLLEILTGLIQNITTFLPTLLAESQKNNRALKHLCDYTEYATTSNYCATGSKSMAPSMLGMVGAVIMVLLLNKVGRFV